MYVDCGARARPIAHTPEKRSPARPRRLGRTRSCFTVTAVGVLCDGSPDVIRPRDTLCVYITILLLFLFSHRRARTHYYYYYYYCGYAASGHCFLKTRTPRPQFVHRTDFQKYILFSRNTGEAQIIF